MKTVEPGSIVKLCYKGRLQETEETGSDKECQKVELQIGAGEIMKGFEEAIIGMAPNESKVFTLKPDEAYGERDERLERTFSRSELPDDFAAQNGEMVALQTANGEQLLATVKGTGDGEVTLDFNHPLAGKSLTFEVEIEEVH